MYSRPLLPLLAIAALYFGLSFPADGADTVCARVELRIEQQLTLEREGFEATLGVSNGLPSALENFRVILKFTDANGLPVAVATDDAPNSEGMFYYRAQTGYTVPTSVASGADQKVAYLLVPTPGSAGTSASGTLYNVGATIKYEVGGQEQVVEISPDSITVRPMPLLELQYFLPGPVYGDDPMTPDVQEPIIPFPVAVRVSNHSAYASALKVKIESGQPIITANDLGLLIDFRIVGCQVNGGTTAPSLLVDFGDIAPKRAGTAWWLMTSSLSGRFVRFSAQISHAPEFGGDLTSLIPEDAISTHRLIGLVRVDLPGRDMLADYLSSDSMTGEYSAVKVYESDRDDGGAPVDYFPPGSGAVVLQASGMNANLSINTVSPLLLARMVSPVSSLKTVKAVRSDGKVLPASNSWITPTQRDGAPGQWDYWLNLFDTDKTDGQTYALTFSEPVSSNRAPVLTLSGGPVFRVRPGSALSVGVLATDPDGTIPMLSTGMLPDGASFADTRDGHGRLSWTPTADQLGDYTVQFRASDGSLGDSKTATLRVTNTAGGYSDWTSHYWPDITDSAIIGAGADPDGDRIPNLLEYAMGSDPTSIDDSVLPQIGAEVVEGQRYLTLTYQQRTDDPTLVFAVVAAGDASTPLASWAAQATTMDIDQTGLPDGFTRVKIRDSQAIGYDASQRFLRLRITQSGND